MKADYDKGRKKALHRIAAAVDFRDDYGVEGYYLMFRDPPLSVVQDVFSFLVGGGKGIAERVEIVEEHDVVRRNGKGYWRKTVRLVNPNFSFCGEEAMKLLIEAAFKQKANCVFTWMPVDKFLNI